MTDQEVTDLRRRLSEAEDTIWAIRHGEVDALVVGDNGHAAVFDIGGDTESYRTFMEVMEVGAAAVDATGRTLYINAKLGAALEVPLAEAAGGRFSDLIGGNAGAAIQDLLSSGHDAGQTEISLPHKGTEAHFIVAAKRLRLGTTEAFALTFTDVTERVRGEVAVQSERAARAVIASANEAVLVCDRDGIITHFNAAATTLFEGDAIGRTFGDTVPLIFPGATGLMQADDIVSLAIKGTSVRGIEAIAPHAPRVNDYLVSAAPLQMGNDEISGCVITMIDLSQRKAAENSSFS